MSVLSLISKIIFASAIALALNLPVSAQNPNPQSTQTVTKSPGAANTPATRTVNEFYRLIREKNFREAIMMTNWRAAVETLSPQEVADLRPDFEALAAQAKVEITGEQVSGSAASVFVKGIDPETRELKIDEIKLRRENSGWIIVMGDEQTEAAVRREGKNYFFKLRLENRHADAQAFLQDIVKAQLVHSLQNKGLFTDLATLVKANLLPAEILGAETGYRYRLTLSPDRKKYAVNAEPVQYGRSGKLSFLLESMGSKDGKPSLKSDDNGGKPYAVKN